MAAISILSCAGMAIAQPAVLVQTIHAPASGYTHRGCLPPCRCVAPPFSGPLSGSFVMRLERVDPVTISYTITDVDITGVPENLGPVRFAGSGRYEIGGEVAFTQRLILDLVQVSPPPFPDDPETYRFDSGTVPAPAEGPGSFPSISIGLATEQVFCTVRSMHVQSTGTSVPRCPADFNNDGAASVQDLLDFLGAYFDGEPAADVNGSGSVTMQDVLDFVGAYFTACP
jgi:hypothetical protein